MGLFSLFKRDLSNDPDLTRLRDLIVIGAADSDYSLKENETIVDICHRQGIPAHKIETLFKIAPERIKDIYPMTLEAKGRYLRQLIEVMTVDEVCYAEEIEMLYFIARNIGFTQQQVDEEVETFCQQAGKKKGARILASFQKNK